MILKAFAFHKQSSNIAYEWLNELLHYKPKPKKLTLLYGYGDMKMADECKMDTVVTFWDGTVWTTSQPTDNLTITGAVDFVWDGHQYTSPMSSIKFWAKLPAPPAA